MSQICCPIFGLDSGSFGLCDLHAPLGGSLFAGVRFWTGRGSQLLNAGSKDGPVQVSPPPADGSLKSPKVTITALERGAQMLAMGSSDPGSSDSWNSGAGAFPL